MLEGLQLSEPTVLADMKDSNASDPTVSGEFSIDDVRVRELVARLGVILHDQIADGGTFFKRGGGYDHRLALPMDSEELAGWESVFGLAKVIKDAVDKRSLFVVSIDDEPDALPAPSVKTGLVRPFTPAPVQRFTDQGPTRDTIRVNYGGQAHWIPRSCLTLVEDTESLTHLVNPQIHFGGYLSTPGHLYNAFVALDTYIQAENGTQLVSKIPGTGIPGSPTSEPVYSPHRAIATSLWMNTSIKEGEPNSLSVRIDGPELLVLHCDINDIGALPQLEVPASDKLRMWFWQLDRLVSDQRFVLPSHYSTPQIEAN